MALVDVLEAYDYLFHDIASLSFRELAPYFLQIIKVSPIAVFKKQVVIVGCALEVNETDHIRMSDFVQNFDLVLQVVSQPLAHLVSLLDFAGVNLGLVCPQAGFINCAEHSFPDGIGMNKVVAHCFH